MVSDVVQPNTPLIVTYYFVSLYNYINVSPNIISSCKKNPINDEPSAYDILNMH